MRSTLITAWDQPNSQHRETIISTFPPCLQEVIRLESLCKELYESQDAGVRTEAEKALVAFQNSPDSLGER